jgi:uncharacterized membrane protein
MRYMLGVIPKSNAQRQFLLSLFIAGLVSVGLYLYGAVKGYNDSFSYLPWNLFLAALPLVFAVRLTTVLRIKSWSSWESTSWSLLWLLFLPNSFYMISDFIHLATVPSSTILYIVVLFTSFIFLGVVLGFCSLCLIHRELVRRIGIRWSAALIGLILLGSSFAIYIGRDLRWNSWDVLISPAGLLFDISDRLLKPEAYPDMFVTVVSFFVLLASLYGVLWSAARVLRRSV